MQQELDEVEMQQELDEVQQDIIKSVPDLVKDNVITEETGNIFLESIKSIESTKTSPGEVLPTILNEAGIEKKSVPLYLKGKKIQEFLTLLTNNIQFLFSRDDYGLESTQKQLINKGLVPISKLKIMGN